MKSDRLSILLTFLLTFSITFAQGSTKIKGKVLGENNKPLKKINVFYYGDIERIPAKVKYNARGEYEFTINKNFGSTSFQISSPDYAPIGSQLILSGEDKIVIDFKLPRYKYKDTFSNVVFINSSDQNAPRDTMKPMPDGLFEIIVDSKKDTLKYQLTNILNGDERTINGTQYDLLEYDGGGDYYSVLTNAKGKIRIVFDPKKLVRGSSDYTTKFVDPNSFSAIVNKASEISSKISEEFMKAYTDFRASGKDLKEFKYDFNKQKIKYEEALKNENNEVLKQILALNYIRLESSEVKIDKALAKKYLDKVAPVSKVWSINPNNFFLYARIAFNTQLDEEKYKMEMLNHKDPNVKAEILYRSLLWDAKNRRKDDELAKKYYDRLKKECAETRLFKEAQKEYEVVSPGKSILPFELVSLDNPLETITEKNMLGKIYLIDFWATWCGPCIGEMENLHKVYQKFKDKGFEILSISFDGSPDDVKKFRSKDWKMPWMHSFAAGGFDSKIGKDFGVFGIPKPILVGKDGKILETNNLRGQMLDQTLEKTFSN